MIRLTAIFALGFTHLWMLGWLAAAAAPLIIHLWNKRRYREVSWAAMEYLLAAMRKNSRRIRVEQWLLLAVRTAIIVLAVLAVAGPFLQYVTGQIRSGQPTLKVLVIDGSFSMGYKPTDKTRFDRAKQLAIQIVEQSRAGDGFALLLMSAPPRVLVDAPVSNAHDVIEEIDHLQLPHGGADLPATLAQAEAIVGRAQRESRWSQSEVYFFTDLGRNTWNADVKAAAERLRQSTALVVVDLGQPESDNLAVSSLRTVEPYAAVKHALHFEAQLINFSRQPRRQPVQWWVDDQQVREEFVELPAAAQQAVGLEWRFDQPGDHVVEVRLPGDALAIDNHRWLAVPVRPFVDVLVINGDGSAEAARFLLRALNPETDAAQSPIHVHVAAESTLLETDLAKYDVVFASNVSQFTAAEAQLLSRYVRSGGGLVMFLGDRVQADRYNEILGGGRAGDVRLLPALLDQPVTGAAGDAEARDRQFSFDALEYRHAIVAEFAGNERAGLLTTPIGKYFRLKPLPAATRAKVALALRESGDPVVIEESIGEGRVVLFGLPASLASVDSLTKTPWTLMPAWHSFLPLVQETLALAVRHPAGQQNEEVGAAISGSVTAVRGSDDPVLIEPPVGEQRREPIRVIAGPDGRWSYNDTWQSGIYRARQTSSEQNATESTTTSFAVNVDTGGLEGGESNLAKIEPDELPREFVTLTSWQNLDQRPSTELAVYTNIHRWFLFAALALMLVETSLAWWLGWKAA